MNRLVVPEAMVAPALRLMRANRTFVTADGARRRVRERELRPKPYGPPRRLRSDLRVSVTHERWPVYTLTPRHADATGSVVYVHGGGWVNEIAPQHWQLAAQIAVEARTTVVLPIYPLVPFGDADEANRGVVDLVRRQRDRAGRTMIAGDSAGGQIALSAALTLRDADGTAPSSTVLISPALDLTWSNPRIPEVQPRDPWLATPGGRVLAELWRGELDILDPVVSPLAGDMTGLGRITVFSGTRDVLNPDSHLLVQKARAAGVSVEFHEGEGQVHVFPLLPTRVGRQARATVVRSIRRDLRGDADVG
ncbi:alpha/beta hydrolase fold domain-containing protein [Microbacterium sp. P06]|uniref:alpha/beta hydrolase fold domain-containing protein n=1 Tax=Microbacterium sp. P06 TaxID=3366949 RepID=UPI003745670A